MKHTEIIWMYSPNREFFLGFIGVGHIFFDVDPPWWATHIDDENTYLLNWVVA